MVIRNHNLKIKAKKCKFSRLTVSNGEIRPSAAKVEAINNNKKPENLEEILAFIGMASHYRKFVKVDKSYSNKSSMH